MEDLTANFSAAAYALKILCPVFLFAALVVCCLALMHRRWPETSFFFCLLIFAVFAAFGATIGMFMGASRSDIVSSLLPPIITLISGYIVFIGSKDLSPPIRVIVPCAVLALLVCLLFSAYYMKSWYTFVPVTD